MTGAAIVWLIAVAIFCIIEGMTVALVSIWMAVASFVAAIVAMVGGSILIQILTFLLVSALLMIATVPLSKQFRKKQREKTNADRVIGADAVVIERIDPIDNKGKIKVMGQIWSAADLHQATVDVGEKVTVRSIEGVRAVVEKRKL